MRDTTFGPESFLVVTVNSMKKRPVTCLWPQWIDRGGKAQSSTAIVGREWRENMIALIALTAAWPQLM
jgi:hypothetical protein